MSPPALRLVSLAALAACVPHADASCRDAFGAGTLVASSPRYEIAFRPAPAIEVAKHFALDIVVCPKGSGTPDALAVDAWMPEHAHGMNYRPSVTKTADGRYRAEGLLLHMPGLWEFRFDVTAAGERERAVLRREVP